MMQNYFEEKSESEELYKPEFIATKEINSIIANENKSQIGIDKIEKILKEIDIVKHINGVQWFDYKIHLNFYIHNYWM